MAASPEGQARLLVVDDSQVNRKLLVRSLEAQGHLVASAENGRVALELLRAQSCDLILLDVEMPELDGYQTLAALKEDPDLRHLPVIMVTAVDELESAIRCIELGADDYLPKPFNQVLLRARIGAGLEKKRLRDREQLYLKGLERELDIAREIQAGFLPDELPKVPGWEIAASLRAAREVAGDFYDAFPLKPGDEIGLVIADVCDKGIGAALFMTLFRSLIRAASITEYFGAAGGMDAAGRLRLAFRLTNDYIANTHGDTGMFATMFFGILQPADGTLTYVNAGHEPPLILGPGGVRETLQASGPAVGILPDQEFVVRRVELAPGEMLFAFTDGAFDATNPAGEFFGRERLLALLKEPASMEALLQKIAVHIQAYIAGGDQFDDITLLGVQRLATAGS